MKSLLRADGVDPAAYRDRFGSTVEDDFPQLSQLVERGWLTGGTGLVGDARLRLTDEGLARGDAIGPWLVSGPVRHAMASYEWE